MINNLLGIKEILQGVGSVLLALLLLLLMITVHEFGHYIAGKALKFKIKEFSVGFGPALFKKKSKKTDELFCLRLIPLGGYCSFDDEDGTESEEEEKEGGMPGKEEVFLDATVTPEERLPSAEKEKKSFAERVAADRKVWDEKEKSGCFCDMRPWKRIIVFVAGATMNYLTALVLIFLSLGIFGQLLIGTMKIDAPTDYSLQDHDVIISAEGVSVYTTSDLMSALQNRQEGDVVKMYVSRVTESEDGTHAREKMEVSVRLRCATNFKNSTDIDRLWESLGVAKDDDGVYMAASYRCKLGFFETIGRGFVYSFKIAGSVFKVFGELLTGALGIDSMGGPVTTITVASQVVSRGVQPFLEMAAYIGVNLAVLNLLPIPALDGSKVVFTLIEWVRGKPVNRNVEAIIHTIGMLLLLGFSVSVDLLHFF